MHPLRVIVEASVQAGLDFMVVLGGNRGLRQKMGLPQSVLDKEPLLLSFPSSYHAYSQPMGDEEGLSCVLSFDSLYNCRIPWSAIAQFVIQNQTDDSWPASWEPEEASTEDSPAAKAEDAPPPDNVRQFRPRPRKV